MKRKTAVIISFVMFTAAGLFCVISAVAGLLQSKRECDFFSADKGERIFVETQYITSCVYEVEHSVNFIPAGHEYYYAFLDEDGRAYLARLGKSFGEGLEDGIQHTSGLCLAVTGKVKRLKSTPELRETAARFSEAGITLATDYYLDTIYQVNYLWRLVVGFGFLLFSGAFVIYLRSFGALSAGQKVFCGIAVVTVIISLLGGIYLLNMG